ncbi:MAG: anthranilate synthase component I family protein [Planctomycetes bacterium]|nr:anthranilate synthase component I family protein [Planctomycetota bacterium]
MSRSAPEPVVCPLEPVPDVEEVFLRLSRRAHCLFLDSAMRDPVLGRYSFIAADPWEYIELAPDSGDSLGELAGRMATWQTSTVAGLPPFQGGAAGFFAYDLGRDLERLPRPRVDEFGVPAMAVGFYDVVVAFDHVDRRAWIVSQGFPEIEPARRHKRAVRRMEEVRRLLDEPVEPLGEQLPRRKLPDIPPENLARQYAVDVARGGDDLTSNFSPHGYLKAIRRVIAYITAGDAFQVNLAQRLLCRARDDSVSLYRRLRQRNAAPFAGYFDTGPFQIVSASPERFLRVVDRQVETRPIKGTRPRSAGHADDATTRNELLASEKDRAENVMIVDLLRNDLSRVCLPESVHVSQLCEVETYQYVQHLVSAVCGTLGEGRGPIDLLRASFPGGSITGAPKVRAMEIIAELEPTARGAYCGSMGYLGLDGSLDLNILIRTITAGRGWWQFPVGGGIVVQSDPEQEYEETWDKARGLICSL